MTTPTPEQVAELVERLRAIDRSGGPDPPWEAVGSTSIRTPGRDMFLLTESNDFTNPWTRQKICDAINLVGEAASTLTALLAALQESERDVVRLDYVIDQYRGIDLFNDFFGLSFDAAMKRDKFAVRAAIDAAIAKDQKP